jgi:hypothetical protein
MMWRSLPVTSFAALLIAQAPPAGKAEALADLYGQTLGAASQCQGVAPEQLATVARKAADHIKVVAAGDAAAATSLDGGIARGRRAVASGAESCAQAESEFADLAHELDQ